MMMKLNNIIIGIGNRISNTCITLTKQKFEVTEKWFRQIYDKHYTSDIQSKFDTELFVDPGIGEEIFESIAKQNKKFQQLQNQLRILNDLVYEFLKYYEELQELLKNQSILINKNSRQYIQLELLKSRAPAFTNQINQYSKILESNELDKINSLIKFDNAGLEVAREFKLTRIDDYEPDDKFISTITSEKEEAIYLIKIVFERLFEIVNQIISVNTLFKNINNKSQFIHGNAGMGKSNLAAFLTTKLINEKLPVIFIKARSFNGDPDQFDKILMAQLEIPDNYRLSEVLTKLNTFGKENKKRVTLIIDGLNETSYGTNGFSPIWKKNIDDFLERLQLYPYIYFVATLRTSYIERVWPSNKIPYKSQELIGFNDSVSLLDLVEKYFNHYKIKFNSPDQSDIFYFQTPLLLDLYCKMLNSDKKEEIDPIFGLEGFVSVFERYINNLSKRIQTNLSLVSAKIVNNGIERCSEEFLKKMGAFLNISTYYSCVEGKEVTTVNDTVAHSILEEYLIYLKDSFNNSDVVVHTQQEVGGYLLAKTLLNKYNNNVKKLVAGKFFSNHIVGEAEEQHQLANDILKFIIVLSGEYHFLIENYGNVSSVKDYLWIKLQREDANTINIQLRKTLSDKLKSKNDIIDLLDKSKSRLFHPDSPLNFLYNKLDILKMKAFDFELTWTRYIYQNFRIFSDFLQVDYEEHEKTGQLDISLEITIWLLESTSHNMRDEATKKLLEYGFLEPNFIFSKVVKYSTSQRTYIYERLAGIAYGICLRKQNDLEFVNNELKGFAETVYDLQFSSIPEAPSYHYIVIDSFKHIIELAVHLGVFQVPEKDILRFSEYKFFPDTEWQKIDENEINNVSLEWKGYPDPDPLSGDFVTYTIPRLLKSTEKGYIEAVAHIYKRIISAGYQPDAHQEMHEGVDRDFYLGVKQYSMNGKIDRLGKKYSWNAFFEYAGHLINVGNLAVLYEGDSSVTNHYDRLSDVELEVSCPLKVPLSEKLFSTKLLADKSDSPEWTCIEKFESLKDIFNHDFDSVEYTMLYGYFVENEKSKYSFNVKSFLLVEPFLVKKEDIEGKEEQIQNRTLEWDHDLHLGNTISKTYFGELYWADSIPEMKRQRESIPSTEMREIDYSIIPEGLTFLEQFHAMEMAKRGKKMEPIQIPLTIEPAIVEYLWESDSEIYPSLRGNIPSPNIGKHLNLKADPKNFKILDENHKRAFISVEYEEKGTLKQESDYIRTDLLKKYLKDKGFVLMYQIKQHTFDRNAGDGSGDFRGMQFKIQKI